MPRRMVAFGSLNATPNVLKPIRVKTSTSVVSKTLIVDLGNGAEPATTANTAGADVVLGVCMDDVTNAAANEQTKYDTNIDQVYEMPFTNAGTKKTFTLADVGKKYQLASGSASILDPDNTTNGFLELVSFDNSTLVARVLIHNRKQGVL